MMPITSGSSCSKRKRSPCWTGGDTSTSASKPVHPEFVVAMRGYDRLQVDEYVARLIEWMDDAQTRAEQAEADLALTRQETASLRQQVRAMQEESLVGGRPAVDAAGSTLASVIEGALGEAHEIRSRAQADAVPADDRRSWRPRAGGGWHFGCGRGRT